MITFSHRCFPIAAAMVVFAGLWTAGCTSKITGGDTADTTCRGPGCQVQDGGDAESADTDDGPRDVVRVDASDDPWVDDDGDGLFNGEDNCPGAANPEQKDQDGDGVGDVCDNCPGVANREQDDTDGRGAGDACDERGETFDATRDSDGDGKKDIDDNCPHTANKGQADSDGDQRGDACDNCPQVANPAQADADGMKPGDACAPEPAGAVCRRFSSDFKQFRPNLYFLLDKSGSMRGGKMNDAKRALIQISEDYQADARFGLTAFSSDCSPEELLKMGKHNAAGVQSSMSRVRASGKTGTGGALATVRSETRFLELGEDPSTKRPRAVIVITDGDANVCGGLSKAKSEAKKLRSQHDVKTYVIGFKSDARPANLDALAQSGGTNSHLNAQNSTQLTAAVEDIFSKIIACDYKLPKPDEGIDPNRIWVKIDGDFVARDAYSYEASSQTLKLGSSACQKLRQASGDPLSDPIEIVLGCPKNCQPEDTEICDYRDNDCDGEIDENCEGCRPEVCDGEDTDCDGQTDEGCPDCQLKGQSCRAAGQCCWGICEEGTCQTGCRPIGVRCQSNGDCCTESCAKSGGQTVGKCVGR